MSSRGHLLIPLALTGWIAWGDLKTRRIPNYLTLGTAVAGLAYNCMSQGLPGLVSGLLGMLLGFACLILPYLGGGMGGGDVKALAALGAWLGPKLTIFLFCYMGIAGGIMALGYLVWQGILWQKIKAGWAFLLNQILCLPGGSPRPSSPSRLTEGIPYGVAIAAGMLILVGVRSPLWFRPVFPTGNPPELWPNGVGGVRQRRRAATGE
jgi:Flp pilus assembly protein protease CpaA